MMFLNLLNIDKKKSKCSEKNTNFGENAKIGVDLPPPPPPPLRTRFLFFKYL